MRSVAGRIEGVKPNTQASEKRIQVRGREPLLHYRRARACLFPMHPYFRTRCLLQVGWSIISVDGEKAHTRPRRVRSRAAGAVQCPPLHVVTSAETLPLFLFSSAVAKPA